MPKEIDGKPIIDAKRGLTLHITDADIKKSDRKRPETCAAANCILREKHAAEVRVHLSRIYIRANKGNWQRFDTPPSLRSEIIAFDRGGDFAPGEYELSPPRQRTTGKQQGGKDKTNLGGKNRPKKRPNRIKRKSPHVVTDVRMGPA